MRDDRRLIAEYLAGSHAAFRALFDLHNPHLYAFAYHLSSSVEDAEDLCQSAWIEAIRSLDTFKGTGTFKAWLHGILLNLYRAGRRKRRLGITELDADRMAAPAAADPAAVVARIETLSEIRAALDSLSPPHREVLILHEFQGLKYREIAQILNCSIGTVKSRLHYSLSALREKLSSPAR